MNLNNHAVSQELSQKLWEMGVRRDSVFVWNVAINGSFELLFDKWKWAEYGEDDVKAGLLPAYLASEVLEMLPWSIKYTGDSENIDDYALVIDKSDGTYAVYYESKEWRSGEPNGALILGGWSNADDYSSLAEAAAKCLIYLLENNYITLGEVNNGNS